jgi:hypothetical protein
MRKTFQTDIPHFFQDDVPCAFGGQPTSGTKTACKGAAPQQAKPPAQQTAPRTAPPPAPPSPPPPAPRDGNIEQQDLPPRR